MEVPQKDSTIKTQYIACTRKGLYHKGGVIKKMRGMVKGTGSVMKPGTQQAWDGGSDRRHLVNNRHHKVLRPIYY